MSSLHKRKYLEYAICNWRNKTSSVEFTELLLATTTSVPCSEAPGSIPLAVKIREDLSVPTIAA